MNKYHYFLIFTLMANFTISQTSSITGRIIFEGTHLDYESVSKQFMIVMWR